MALLDPISDIGLCFRTCALDRAKRVSVNWPPAVIEPCSATDSVLFVSSTYCGQVIVNFFS
jgi:hypothetical protein